MKYMLFAWYSHDACGGMNDFIMWGDSIEDLEGAFDIMYKEQFCTNGQIVNATSLQVEKEL